MDEIILCQNIGLSSRTQDTLSQVSFSLKKGRTLTIVGDSQSGKSTLLSVVGQVKNYDFGSISYFGKTKIGYYFPNQLMDDCTGYFHLKYYAHLKKASVEDIKLVKEIFDLNYLYVPIKKLSEDLRKRLALALAFLGSYELVCLDLPYLSLSKQSIGYLNKAIRTYRDEYNCSFILTSFGFDQGITMADQMIILKNGKIVKSIDSLIYSGLSKGIICLWVDEVEKTLALLEQEYSFEKMWVDKDYKIFIESNQDIISNMIQYLVKHNISVFNCHNTTLDIIDEVMGVL